MKTIVAFFAIIAFACALPQGQESQAQVLRSESNVGPESYEYSYQTSNQIYAQEQGQLKQVGEQAAIAAQGSFQYVSPEGIPIQLSYVADENGYQPQGSHLPQAPAIPSAIQRSIDYILAHQQH